MIIEVFLPTTNKTWLEKRQIRCWWVDQITGCKHLKNDWFSLILASSDIKLMSIEVDICRLIPLHQNKL